MTEDRPPPSPDFEARLRQLRERVSGGRPADDGDDKDAATRSGLRVASRVAIDFAAGVLVGAGAGYGLDSWLGTGPWLLVTLLLLGFAAGMLNAYRTARSLAGPDDRSKE